LDAPFELGETSVPLREGSFLGSGMGLPFGVKPQRPVRLDEGRGQQVLGVGAADVDIGKQRRRSSSQE
jgi:hypothetical protein